MFQKKKKEVLAECLIVQGDLVGYQIITIKLVSTMLLSWILILFFEVATTTISLKFYPVLIKVSSVSPFKKDSYNNFFPSPPPPSPSLPWHRKPQRGHPSSSRAQGLLAQKVEGRVVLTTTAAVVQHHSSSRNNSSIHSPTHGLEIDGTHGVYTSSGQSFFEKKKKKKKGAMSILFLGFDTTENKSGNLCRPFYLYFLVS